MEEGLRRRKLAKLFEIFGFNVDYLKNRIILQKTIYLLDIAGMGLGYRFSYYIYGPYSSTLADDAYNISGNPELLKTAAKLTGAEEECIDRVKKMLDEYPSDSTWYELLGTIVYLKRNKKPTDAELLKELEGHHSYLKDPVRFGKAITILQKNKFLN